MAGIVISEARKIDPKQSVTKLRQDIEVGWQQAERGDAVYGPAVFAEIRSMSQRRRAREKGN